MGWRNDNMENYVLVEQWLQHLSAIGRKDKTLENYRYKVIKCLNVLNDLGRPTDPREITTGDMILVNKNLDLCENSRKDYLKTLGYFIEWITGADLFNRCDILWNNPEPNRLFINEDKFARLMEVADERGRVILLLGGAMGLRREEIRSVRYSDI